MRAKYIPEGEIRKHNLEQYIKVDGWIHFEIGKGMYGIPEAGILANDLLRARLKKHGYIEATHTPGYWKHIWKPISWTLIVDDFRFKYTNKRHVDKLLKKNVTVVRNENGLGRNKLRRYYLQVEL